MMGGWVGGWLLWGKEPKAMSSDFLRTLGSLRQLLHCWVSHPLWLARERAKTLTVAGSCQALPVCSCGVAACGLIISGGARVTGSWGLAPCMSAHDLLIFLLWKGTCSVADSGGQGATKPRPWTLGAARGWVPRLQGSEAATLRLPGGRPVMEVASMSKPWPWARNPGSKDRPLPLAGLRHPDQVTHSFWASGVSLP